MPLPPDYPPSHEPLDLDLVWDLSDVLVERVGDGPLEPGVLEEVARAEGHPIVIAYVAASIDPSLPWAEPERVTIHACAGGCQAWGAVDVITRLLEERAEREAADQPLYNVRTHPCLSLCDKAPVLVSTGPHGHAPHLSVNAKGVPEIVAALCDH